MQLVAKLVSSIEANDATIARHYQFLKKKYSFLRQSTLEQQSCIMDAPNPALEVGQNVICDEREKQDIARNDESHSFGTI